MTRRALVTGGAGFIGSHVAELFLAEGYAVTVVDDLSSGKRENLDPRATFHHASIADPSTAALVRDGGFDVLCHLAAQIDVRRSVADPAWDASVNIGGTLNLLEAVRASGKATRVIFSSSGGAQYGDLVERPTPEEAAKDPASPYGITKLSAEYYLSYYARIHGMDTVSLRYGNVYGPRQDPHGEAGVVAIFCGRILDGRPLTVFGDGGQTRDYVYVGDVARSNLLAAHATLAAPQKLDDRGFNVGTGVETSVLALAETLQRVAGVAANVEHAPPRAGEQRASCLSIAKAKAQLGWAPEMPIDRGLRATFEFFQARRTA